MQGILRLCGVRRSRRCVPRGRMRWRRGSLGWRVVSRSSSGGSVVIRRTALSRRRRMPRSRGPSVAGRRARPISVRCASPVVSPVMRAAPGRSGCSSAVRAARHPAAGDRAPAGAAGLSGVRAPELGWAAWGSACGVRAAAGRAHRAARRRVSPLARGCPPGRRGGLRGAGLDRVDRQHDHA